MSVVKRNAVYFSKERQNMYDSLKTNVNTTVKKLEISFSEFVERYFSHYTKDEFGNSTKLSQFHLDTVDTIENATTIELAVKMARNHAKTTVFGLFLPIYLMLKQKTKVVLYVGSSKDAAVKQLINIQIELETNSLLINDFGNFQKTGNWSKGSFIVDSYQTAFFCLGKGQTPRGIKYKNNRPDLIILDDIDTDDDVRNKEIITKQTNWVYQALFPALSLKQYKFLVLGNQFAPDMVLTRIIEQTPNIQVLSINALDENDNVSWKERFSLEDITRMRQTMGEIRFQREFMNNPIIEGSIFKPEWIQFWRYANTEINFIITYVDPSYTTTGDYKAAVSVGYGKNTYYILDMFIVKVEMWNLFNYLYDLNYNETPHTIYIESNMAQIIHKQEYDRISKIKGRNLPIVWDKSKKDNKIARIESLTSYFEQDKIKFNGKLEHSSHFKQFYNDYLTFPTGKHDDSLDALQSAINVIDGKTRNMGNILTGYRNSDRY